jgi:hypothetical protein
MSFHVFRRGCDGSTLGIVGVHWESQVLVMGSVHSSGRFMWSIR